MVILDKHFFVTPAQSILKSETWRQQVSALGTSLRSPILGIFDSTGSHQRHPLDGSKALFCSSSTDLEPCAELAEVSQKRNVAFNL